MKVLITGASGYLGCAVAGKLASEHEVVGISRGITTGFSKQSFESLVNQDICHYPSLHSLFSSKKFDAVVHLAAVTKTSTISTLDSLSNLANTNVCGTVNLLKCAREFHSRFVFASSMTVYGVPKYLPVDEKHPLNPTSVYGCSKVFGEECVKFFSKSTGLNSTVVRLPGLFGPPRTNGAVHDFITGSLKNKTISINLDEDLTWSVLHVEDAADAIIKALGYSAGAVDFFNVFNAGYSDEIEIREFAKKIINLTNSSSKIQVSGGGKSFPFAFDVEKSRRVLGFKPPSLSTRLNEYIGVLKSGVN